MSEQLLALVAEVCKPGASVSGTRLRHELRRNVARELLGAKCRACRSDRGLRRAARQLPHADDSDNSEERDGGEADDDPRDGRGKFEGFATGHPVPLTAAPSAAL